MTWFIIGMILALSMTFLTGKIYDTVAKERA